MSAELKEQYPEIMETSTPGFFYVQSSNKYDVYGVLVTGKQAALCSCEAAAYGRVCWHRRLVLKMVEKVKAA